MSQSGGLLRCNEEAVTGTDIDKTIAKVLEMYQIGTNSLLKTTSTPSGENGKISKVEHSSHGRIYNLLTSLKSIGDIMKDDLNKLTHNVEAQYEQLQQQSAILQIHIDKLDTQLHQIQQKSYQHLDTLDVSDSIQDKFAIATDLKTQDNLHDILIEEQQSRQELSTSLNKLTQEIQKVTDDINRLCEQNSLKVKGFESIYNDLVAHEQDAKAL